MRLYLIRHAESDANITPGTLKNTADCDIGITPLGEIQAYKAGNWLARFIKRQPRGSMVKLWHSPYKRAKFTADIILSQLGRTDTGGLVHECICNDQLREQNLGVFGGLTLEERGALFPEEHALFQREWEAGRSYWAPRPGGESREAVATRMDTFIPELLKDAASGVTDCVIVGHGIANRLLVKQLMGKSVKEFDQEANPGNCHIRMLEIDHDGKTKDLGYVYLGTERSQSL